MVHVQRTNVTTSLCIYDQRKKHLLFKKRKTDAYVMPMISFFFLHAASATVSCFCYFHDIKRNKNKVAKQVRQVGKRLDATAWLWAVFRCVCVAVCVSVLCGAHGVALCSEKQQKSHPLFSFYIGPSSWHHLGFVCACMHVRARQRAQV